MWPNPQETADSVTFTEEILNGKLHFCAVTMKESGGWLQRKITATSSKLYEKGHNSFPQINTVPFKFPGINHRLPTIMDACNKCCEINTVL